jgi:hypothetical protein
MVMIQNRVIINSEVFSAIWAAEEEEEEDEEEEEVTLCYILFDSMLKLSSKVLQG